MKIVFMGTPDFAAKGLEALYNAGHSITAVFTQPDKPRGRKKEMTPPDVKVAAEKFNISVFQPATLRDGEAEKTLSKLEFDVIIVIAYGKILPESILQMPKKGCINVHASLLPKYRGASPIQWSIVCGEKTTGVTTMLMDKGMDTGDILLQKIVPIDDNDTAETLFDKLADTGADLIIETLEKLDNIEPKPQGENATYAPIINKDMGEIDFKKTASEIDCLVRGLNPWPCASLIRGGKRIKIYKTVVLPSICGKPGEVIYSDKKLVIACKDSAIQIVELQPEGKKRMTADDFLNGNHIEKGSKFID